MVEHKCKNHSNNECKKPEKSVYGEFIRTFTFEPSVQLPIVQPGGNLIFPIETVKSKNITYVEEENRIGLLVPKGTYLISYIINPSQGATINLLVNNKIPTSKSMFPYGKSIVNDDVFIFFLFN